MQTRSCSTAAGNEAANIRSVFEVDPLTHWHTQPAVRRAEPSMSLLLIVALCQ
jgi:hypothetical protein